MAGIDIAGGLASYDPDLDEEGLEEREGISLFDQHLAPLGYVEVLGNAVHAKSYDSSKELCDYAAASRTIRVEYRDASEAQLELIRERLEKFRAQYARIHVEGRIEAPARQAPEQSHRPLFGPRVAEVVRGWRAWTRQRPHVLMRRVLYFSLSLCVLTMALAAVAPSGLAILGVTLAVSIIMLAWGLAGLFVYSATRNVELSLHPRFAVLLIFGGLSGPIVALVAFLS